MRTSSDIVDTAQRPFRTRVSFDLDDTLTCHRKEVPREQNRFLGLVHRWLGEPLRHGTCALMRELRRRKCSIWIYTSSSRSPAYIRRWFLLHGIMIDGIVNSELHRHHTSSHGIPRPPSKYPPAFGIDLHVDDSEGVRMEGEQHGFQVVVVDPHDRNWVQRVLDAVSQVQAAGEKRFRKTPKRISAKPRPAHLNTPPVD